MSAVDLLDEAHHGRRVVVTGGTSGIGLAIAEHFAVAGASVLVTGRDEERAARALGALEVPAGSITFRRADVSSRADCELVARTAVEQMGGIDVLCANAGVYPEASIAEMTEGDLDEMIAVNLKGSLLSVQACLDELRRSPAGRVVLVSSITGPLTGLAGMSHYGAAKAGQLGFMRSAAVELAPFGITVNAVLPGNTLTPGLEALGDSYASEMVRSIPLGRLGLASEIARAVAFLASPRSGFITGHGLVVDGGQTLPEGDASAPPGGGLA
jgi:3-oxoacyl-[acyl-carrier protein] reductase